MDSDTIQPTKEREDTPPRRKPPPAPLQTHQGIFCVVVVVF